ncbi:hypothetical protein EGW08_014508 [Elysia chlorotica]|uniref:Uncharacterized protein n=1 Tax=Elysia chlorotica TaxID=188477 RepID=A0A3S0ZLL0_ELYCH|nr:hypothetical protein EGW08_014508 [Elysia chlorotica]
MNNCPRTFAGSSIKYPRFSVQQETDPDLGIWNPVAWSDYPKQPMWTVPMPKIPAPVSIPHNTAPPRPRCEFPPTDIIKSDKCPHWVPGMPHKLPPTWNAFVNENNMPYASLVGPRMRKTR